MKDWHQYATLIVSAGAAAGVLLALWKWLSKAVFVPVSRWFDFLNAAISELSPNGGASIFDRIKRIDASTQLASGRVLTLMDRAPQPVFECSPDGGCTYANHAICDLFGLSRDEMLGKGWYRGLDQADIQRVYAAWMDCVKNGLSYECDYGLRDSDITVRASANPMVGGVGQIIGFSGTIRILEPK